MYLTPYSPTFDAHTVDFGRFVATETLPMSAKADSDIRGGWAVFGSEEQAVAFKRFLDEQGFRYFDEEPATFPKLVSKWNGMTGLLLPTSLALLAISTAIADVLFRARRQAVLSLHGHSPLAQLADNARTPLIAFAASTGVAALILGSTAAFTDSTHALPVLLAQAAMYCGILATAFFLAFAATFALVETIPVLHILNGEHNSGIFLWIAHGLRVFTLIPTITIAVALPLSWHSLDQWKAADRAAQSFGDIASLTF